MMTVMRRPISCTNLIAMAFHVPAICIIIIIIIIKQHGKMANKLKNRLVKENVQLQQNNVK